MNKNQLNDCDSIHEDLLKIILEITNRGNMDYQLTVEEMKFELQDFNILVYGGYSNENY